MENENVTARAKNPDDLAARNPDAPYSVRNHGAQIHGKNFGGPCQAKSFDGPDLKNYYALYQATARHTFGPLKNY